MALHLDALRDVLTPELANDPLGRGYENMTDLQIAADLNTSYRATEHTSVNGAQIFNAIVPSEYVTLSATDKAMVQWITQLGDAIDLRVGTNARTALQNAFVAGTSTRTNLASLVNTTMSRAHELNLPETVMAMDIAAARSV